MVAKYERYIHISVEIVCAKFVCFFDVSRITINIHKQVFKIAYNHLDFQHNIVGDEKVRLIGQYELLVFKLS